MQNIMNDIYFVPCAEMCATATTAMSSADVDIILRELISISAMTSVAKNSAVKRTASKFSRF
jgi:hypothetical protein